MEEATQRIPEGSILPDRVTTPSQPMRECSFQLLGFSPGHGIEPGVVAGNQILPVFLHVAARLVAPFVLRKSLLRRSVGHTDVDARLARIVLRVLLLELAVQENGAIESDHVEVANTRGGAGFQFLGHACNTGAFFRPETERVNEKGHTIGQRLEAMFFPPSGPPHFASLGSLIRGLQQLLPTKFTN